ncbi:MAG: DEAD/DEAH box helicase [Myxococcales bacterium]|nr:DEAD/DEAH box helicase [Myxococcales bacterium]
MSTGAGATRSAPDAPGGPTGRVDTPPGQGLRLVTSHASVPHQATLRITYADPAGCDRYALALASLFSGVVEELVAIDANGRLRDDLALDELQQRLRARRIDVLRWRMPRASRVDRVSAAIVRDEGAASVSLTLPFLDQPHGSTVLWLQADPDCLDPLPLLALPNVDGAFALDALHALVALGVRVGGFVSAQLLIDGATDACGTWQAKKVTPEARPVLGSHQDSVWSVGADAKANQAVAWFTAAPAADTIPEFSADWCARLSELLQQRSSADDLERHLRTASPGLPPLRVVDRQHAPPGPFMVTPEIDVVCSLHPTADEVVIAVDLQQPPASLELVLQHALAHLALGHIRPGDACAHWDTLNTASSATPHRAWDRAARSFLTRVVSTPPPRRVESLDECTPLEKAQLGLWRMIGEMIGERLEEKRRLHPAADRYQQAAYQRQAAQRLVSMLEDYGGAMLCDGVGLGKTYVATTTMVHYANAWRDQWAADPDRVHQDPFLITILAPHSVVSTWRREALPGLAAFGVHLANIRVLSHTQLSRVVKASDLLAPGRDGRSDLEHLMLSDLVIVDEAHNFRSLAARRTKVLRDLLRVQPRRDSRRRVMLLTATPINNSLEDLRQEVSLLFSRPLWMSNNTTPDGYRRAALKELRDRCTKVRAARFRGDPAPIVVHGQADARFSDSIEFRDDLDFGPRVERLGAYLKEQDKRLKETQDRIRTAAQSARPSAPAARVRIGEDLLDRIVVQRSRSLCKEIERQQSSTVELLFRPDAGPPEKLRYSDEYDGIKDVLARFLPLFDGNEKSGGRRALSLKIYMWYDVRQGLKTADEVSSVVGLQRVLVLKRLESSPVSFLITLLRLAVLHAHRLQQLGNLCLTVGDRRRAKELQRDLDALLARQDRKALDKIRSLATGEVSGAARHDFIASLSAAYASDRPAADPDDPPPQLGLFDADDEGPGRDELDRLWTLREAVLADFETLLDVAPGLADVVFGKFTLREWPRRFIAGGEAIDWPKSAAWGLRLVKDAKLRQLVARLLAARRLGQKVVVFSQFSDTIAYIQSVLAASKFSREDWQVVRLGLPEVRDDDLTALIAATATVTGATEDRDEVVNAFAPYYRIGPSRPSSTDEEREHRLLDDAWEASWTGAILNPVDVVLSTDVLAEGVNLQDAALLINYDVHWNPVRMIQRAGRIDRRLNPRIEHGREFPDLAALAARLGRPLPQYYWHTHHGEPPVTVNMILPDELEQELLLRERIATKTLAIDFTLGLEQGTGAEADWMATYTYQGVVGLNSFQRDRAIERVASYHERIRTMLMSLGVDLSWIEGWNGWVRTPGSSGGSPILARARFHLRTGEERTFTRYLAPAVRDGTAHWLWTSTKPAHSLVNFWIALDGETFPPATRRDLGFHDDASRPMTAEDLLAAAIMLVDERIALVEVSDEEAAWPLLQGATAIAAGFLETEADRSDVQQTLRGYQLLQLGTLTGSASTDQEREQTCG